MTSCVPQVNHEVKHEGVNHYNFSRDSSFSGSTTQQPAAMSTLRDMIHRSHDQTEDDHQVLDLVYITERIISMSFPSEGHEASYRYNLKEVMNMLKTKHGDNCLILNISEPRQDLSSLNPQRVIEYCWPDHLAPPLERLCNICKSMDSWLNSDPNHVIVIHCKGGRSRLAVVIAAYMHYCSICASADQALDRFAMKRFYDDKLGGLAIPSHKRYVQYFAGLLSGAIKINSSPLYLHHLVIHGVPNFDTRGGCRPFIKVYQGMQAIFTSGVYNVTDQMQKVCISISPGIPLRGDVLIKCYHKKAKTGQREVMWRCQFHTCAISGLDVTFGKGDLDDALIDPRFPDSGKVEFVFGTSQDARVLVTDFKSDVTVPVDDGTDNLVRWDSYEKIANADGTINDINQNGMAAPPSLDMVQQSRQISQQSQQSNHSQGPLDGNLYAVVTKRKHEQVESSNTILHNGTTYLQNGSSHTSSVDSGMMGSSMSPHGMNDSMQQSYSSMNTSKSSYSSSLPKQSVKPLDEQTQLDVILSDLLNDQVFVTSPQSPPKSGASTLTKDSRTFRTYDSKVSPDGKTTYQSAEVTYKMPGGYREERNYTMTSKSASDDGKFVPAGAFSYTTSPELARKSESQRTNTLPYRTDYDNRYHSESSYNYRTLDGQHSLSDSDQTSSWLQQQQSKLRQRKDSKDDKRVEQEKKLVEELRSAQNKYYTKRAQNEAEEQAVMESYKMSPPPPPLSNGPISPSYPGGYNTGTIDRTEKKETLERDRSRLDELEKSLQAAQNSIIATQPQWQTQQVAGNTADFKEQTVTRRVETRRYETNYQQQQQQHHQVVSSYPDRHLPERSRSMSPVWDNVNTHVDVNQVQTPAVPPKQISVVEEDRFSLRPIGPGVQPLEPEAGSQSGTLGRATTPSFPVSPVASAATPPFPVTPGTPYSHQLAAGGSAVTSPTGTLTSQHSQFQNQQQQQTQQHQYQTQQHEYRTQQYNTQYGTEGRTHHGEALQIDTSPRMLSPGSTMTRSPPSVGSPPSPGSLNTLRQQLNVAHSMSSSGGAMSPGPHSMTGQSSPSVYFGMSRRGSLSSIADSVEVHTTPRFVKDTSKFWYKPNITREEAIQLLKDRAPGTFVVRDSNSFPGAFGLALKVSQIPPNVQTKSTGDPSADLVRHFLIEPTPKGVRLRGCSNEPVFGSLASLVYQHSITPLALPCKLVLPEAGEWSSVGKMSPTTMTSSQTVTQNQVVGMDSTDNTMSTSEVPSSAAALLAQGAACNVLYLNSIDTESLTGPQAVSRAVKMTLESQQPKTTVVHFKVSNQGITLTDNQRKLFFRRHYPVSAVTYCGMDPEQRKFRRDADGALVEARMFGFVARKQGGVSDNACHLFAELDPEQPASAIVNFVTKIMIGQSKIKLKS